MMNCVHVYSKDSVMPMIPLGLKETKEVDFREPFTDFILEHYSEEATTYQDAISDFMDMRQVTIIIHSVSIFCSMIKNINLIC